MKEKNTNNHSSRLRSFFIGQEKEFNKEASQYAIYIKNFSKIFKNFVAVNKINLVVPKGVIHGFIGPNGSGKTTTIKAIISAFLITHGEIYVNGHPAGTIAAKKCIGYIPESARFPKRLSALNYLISMGMIGGLSSKEAKLKSNEIIKKIGLYEKRNVDPNDFSSGMKKKLLLAQALMSDPDILILDEPATNLDPTARIELFDELKKVRDEGKTVFISSHILTELQTIADEVTILNFSNIVYTGKLSQEKSIYEFSSDNNPLLAKIARNNKFNVEEYKDSLLINVINNKDLKIIMQEALDNDIKITKMVPYKIDLQHMYEKIVIEANSQVNKKDDFNAHI